MNKSVLISIRPRWIEMIARGEKTIEVRKTRPKLNPPFKCYIYCTRSTDHPAGWLGCYDHDHHKFGLISPLNIEAGKHMNIEVVSGMVVGEFVCSKIDVYDYGYCTHPEIGMDYDCGDNWFCIDDADLEKACLSYEEFRQYADNKDMYGWHISELKIYDEPRDVSDFKIGDACPFLGRNGCSYEFHCFRAGKTKRCGNYLDKAPQSWCYVQNLED